MDLIRSGSARQRAANYRDRADKLRKMADADPVEKIRTLLLEAARQYQELASSLIGENRPAGV
jgi:hypothetical protein